LAVYYEEERSYDEVISCYRHWKKISLLGCFS